jgi:hypothetical protein
LWWTTSKSSKALDLSSKNSSIPTVSPPGKKLGETSAEEVKEILTRAGERFVMHDPTTWPRQAALDHKSKWDELRAWQDQLDGSKFPKTV